MVEEYFLEFQKENCIQCQESYKEAISLNSQKHKYTLPCGCVIINEKCLVDFFIDIFNNFHTKKNEGKVIF